jgi:hypothetical protein
MFTAASMRSIVPDRDKPDKSDKIGHIKIRKSIFSAQRGANDMVKGKTVWLLTAVVVMLLILSSRLPAVAEEPMKGKAVDSESVSFPEGTATPSAVCGACHQAIYREYALGFGSDIRYRDMGAAKEKKLHLPANVSSTATSHAMAGVDPFPVHAREAEQGGKSCNVCHFPEAFELPDLEVSEVFKPKARPRGEESGGLTCASCHLTPQGKVRGPYNLRAPHDMYPTVTMNTSVMCAYCHSMGKRVVGKQTQTFLEWRDDFHKAGLGTQECQDCHMPRTTRKLAEDYAVPERISARHLWTGGRSLQRLQNALSQVIVQPDDGGAGLAIHVINIGAGHSVPSGSNRRAVYLNVVIKDSKGKTAAKREWMFAPSYDARPDDRAYLEEDKNRPDAVAASQADAQGPHEMTIRAGEERVLTWQPKLKPGGYTVQSRLIYDLNRYNDRAMTEDQTVFNSSLLKMTVKR